MLQDKFAGVNDADFVRFLCEARANLTKSSRRLTRLELSLARVQARLYETSGSGALLGSGPLKHEPVEVGSDGIAVDHDANSVVLGETSRESSEAVASQEEVNAAIEVSDNDESDANEDRVVVKTEPGLEEPEVVVKKEPGVSDVEEGQPEAGPSNAQKSSPTPKAEPKKTKKRKSVRVSPQN